MNWQEILNNLKERFLSLTNIQKALVIGIPILVLILGSLVYYVSNKTHYEVLYTGLSSEDMAAIVTQLDKDGVKYKIGQDGRTVLVDENVVRQERLKLAALGIPRRGYLGYNLLNKMPLGITDFMQHVEYQRAVEEELANTILGFKNIQNAKVNLAIPQKSIFIRESEKPSASVFIELKPDASITKSQVIAIRNLVAAAIPGLTPDRVTVVDSEGRDLTAELNNESATSENNQLKMKQALENELTQKLQRILGDAFGYNNVKVSATVDLDFSQTEVKDKTYNPNTIAILSQQKKQETTTGTTVAGVPGTASNIPPMSGQTPNINYQSSKKEITTNYDVSEKKTHIVDKTIKIKRITVGVLINSALKNVNINNIKQLVSAAAGIDPARGDSVSVVEVPFYRPTVPKPPIYVVYAKYGIAGVLAIILLILAIFTLLKLRKKETELEIPAQTQELMESLESLETQEVREKARELITVDKITKIAKEEPEKVASVIKLWLSKKS